MSKVMLVNLAWRQTQARIFWKRATIGGPPHAHAFGSFRPVAVQTLLGYTSAALGLLCELAIAARFGATTQTDTYRWACLLPFYATSLFGGVLIPVFFRSRIFPRGKSKVYVLCPNASGNYGYRATLAAAACALAALQVAALLVGFLFPSTATLFFQSSLFAVVIVLYAILAAPLFFHGCIWLNTLVTTLSNLILLGALLLPCRNFYLEISASMGVVSLILLCIPFLGVLAVENIAFERLAETCKRVPPTALKHVAITGLSNLASIISTTIYFSALTLSGAGLLSIYITTQKAGLLLGVPANAIFNKFIRDDSLANHSANVVSRVLKAVLPVLVISPLFALFSFALLTVVYGIDPASQSAHSIAAGSAAGASLVALTSSMTLLTVGRTSGRHSAIPALASITIAAAGATVIAALHGPTWSIAVPMFGSALASSLGLTWISWRVGHSFRQIWTFAAVSFATAGLMMTLLPRMPLLRIAEWAYLIRASARSHLGF